mgnify:CR=1 FL=1
MEKIIFMKHLIRPVSLLLVISFIGVAVFGFVIFSMAGTMHDMENGCIAKTLNGNICPKDIFEYASYHVSAFNKFLSASTAKVFDPLVPVLLFVAGGLFIVASILKFGLKYRRDYHRNADLIEYRSRRKFSAWNSLLEHSPTF